MNVKKHIVKQMALLYAPLTVNSLTRIISGSYSPRLGIAKELAAITESPVGIWRDPALAVDRQKVIAKYAKKNGLDCHFRRGRPKRGKV